MNTYTIHFETVGCKLNQIETESIARSCADSGFSVSMNHATAADTELAVPLLSIINTCTVTAKAEQKARRIIRLLLTKFPHSPVIVTGCYAEVEQKSIEELDSRIIVIPGTLKDCLADFPAFMAQTLNAQTTENIAPLTQNEQALCAIIRSWRETALDTPKNSPMQYKHTISPFRLATDTFYHHSRGSIKIQDGCSNRCAYCRICIARGKPVSLSADDVLNRVKQIEDAGQTEVVLTGVNLTLYRGKIHTAQGEETYDLVQLLEHLLSNTARISFRISSLYPERVDEDLCRVIANPRIRPHFHLSVQSGSDSVLRAMHRPYPASAVLSAVQKLRNAKPDSFIACDIIAGFPGETDEDFAQTLELCRQCRFTWIHAFPFSPRPGTEAYSMKNQVPQRIAAERVKKLTTMARENKFAYAASFEGHTVRAIIEKRRTDFVRAVTENFLHINIEGNYEQLMQYAGQEVSVRIKKALPITGSEDECEALAELDI